MDTDDYIGRRISLITKREFRYEGILAAINADDQKLSLTRGAWASPCWRAKKTHGGCSCRAVAAL